MIPLSHLSAPTRLATIGVSPKAVLAFLLPLISTAGATLATWVSTGAFDATEIRLSVAGLILSAVAAIGAWVGDPGNVVPK